MNGMLLAEIRRWPRSGSCTVPLLGLAFGIVQCVIVGDTGSATGWDALIAGNVMWATGLVCPAAALLLALVHVRERRARGGGAWWRPGSACTAGICRMLVCAIAVALTNLLVLAPTVVVGYLSLPAAFPAVRLLTLAAVLTLGALVLYPVLELLAARWGTAATLILAVGWMITGVLTAENSRWLLIPPAWPVRATLPLLGTHANGITSQFDDPLTTENPATAVALTAATLMLLIFGYLLAGYGLRSPCAEARPRKANLRQLAVEEVAVSTASFCLLPTGPARRGRTTLLLGQPGTLWRTPLVWLGLAGLAIHLGVVVLWQIPGYAEGFTELALVPVGSVLLGIIGWTSTCEAWPAVATTCHRLGRIMFARLSTLVLILMVIVLIASLLTLVTGADLSRTMRACLLSAAVGWMLIIAAFWLTARFSPGIAAVVNGLGLIASLVLGAGELAASRWLYAPWAWAHTPATLGWRWTILIAGIALLIGFALTPLAAAAMRRRATTR